MSASDENESLWGAYHGFSDYEDVKPTKHMLHNDIEHDHAVTSSFHDTNSTPYTQYANTQASQCVTSSDHSSHETNRSPDIGVHIRNFYATFRIWDEGRDRCLEITNALLDSGATSNFVTPAVVNKFGLVGQRVEPVTFEVANGQSYMTNELVHLTVVASGIACSITAYLKPFESGSLLTIGNPGLQALLVQANFAKGPKKETQVTIARDEKGYRKRRVILEPTYGVSSMTWEDMEPSMWKGENIRERGRRLYLGRLKVKVEEVEQELGYV